MTCHFPLPAKFGLTVFCERTSTKIFFKYRECGVKMFWVYIVAWKLGRKNNKVMSLISIERQRLEVLGAFLQAFFHWITVGCDIYLWVSGSSFVGVGCLLAARSFQPSDTNTTRSLWLSSNGRQMGATSKEPWSALPDSWTPQHLSFSTPICLSICQHQSWTTRKIVCNNCCQNYQLYSNCLLSTPPKYLLFGTSCW